MYLPHPTDTTHNFAPAGFVDRVAQSPAAAAGKATATFDPVRDDETWVLDRVVVSCTSAATTAAVLYTDVEDARHILDFSASGNLDTADNASPLRIGPGERLLVVWTSASNGAVGTVRVQGTLLRRRA